MLGSAAWTHARAEFGPPSIMDCTECCGLDTGRARSCSRGVYVAFEVFFWEVISGLPCIEGSPWIGRREVWVWGGGAARGVGVGGWGGAHAPASKQLRLTLRKSVPSRRSSRALKTPSSCTTMRRSTPSVSGQPWEGSRCVCESTCTTTTKGGEHRVGRRETKSGVSFEAAFVAACSVQAAVPECASVPECALGWVCFGWRASRASAGGELRAEGCGGGRSRGCSGVRCVCVPARQSCAAWRTRARRVRFRV